MCSIDAGRRSQGCGRSSERSGRRRGCGGVWLARGARSPGRLAARLRPGLRARARPRERRARDRGRAGRGRAGAAREWRRVRLGLRYRALVPRGFRPRERGSGLRSSVGHRSRRGRGRILSLCARALRESTCRRSLREGGRRKDRGAARARRARGRCAGRRGRAPCRERFGGPTERGARGADLARAPCEEPQDVDRHGVPSRLGASRRCRRSARESRGRGVGSRDARRGRGTQDRVLVRRGRVARAGARAARRQGSEDADGSRLRRAREAREGVARCGRSDESRRRGERAARDAPQRGTRSFCVQRVDHARPGGRSRQAPFAVRCVVFRDCCVRSRRRARDRAVWRCEGKLREGAPGRDGPVRAGREALSGSQTRGRRALPGSPCRVGSRGRGALLESDALVAG
jgi:hypothetical protein